MDYIQKLKDTSLTNSAGNNCICICHNTIIINTMRPLIVTSHISNIISY
jgi:hypothetical protein